ncbi:DUF5362 family protein [Vreelandella malpeensis]|uniref:DUF5362 domain-containing protein n=1 Tax=Vreelandella malpeensis TaxID=1172368 RepID=A0ABS8DMQ2_9GAMM|nr:DUF5362 family protein [Halomonas malpeensis]MCB8887598.1 DUF5362 domain-containing protein [Halomonas malpeensis]
MDPQEKHELLRSVAEPLYRAKLWMQLIGVMLILTGVLTALTIIGLLVAWVPIWAGVVLMQAAGGFNRAYQSGDERELRFALTKVKTHFTIVGVLLLLYLALFVGMAFLGLLGIGNVTLSY